MVSAVIASVQISLAQFTAVNSEGAKRSKASALMHTLFLHTLAFLVNQITYVCLSCVFLQESRLCNTV